MAGRKKSRKRRIWVAVSALVILLPLLWAFSSRRADPLQGYRAVEAERGSLDVYFSFTGNVQAPNVQTVSAPAGGSIRELYVSPNVWVDRGQRLLRLEDGKILRSEMAGEITELNVRQGDYVSTGKNLLVITDMTRLQVEIRIDEYDVEAIRVGQEVDVNIVALDLPCRGVISAFNKQGETGSQMSSYRAIVDIQSPPDTLLPGMQVEVTVLKDSVREAVLLPRDALNFHDDQSVYVLVRTPDGKAEERDIRPGISDGVTVEVREGLTSGETVLYVPRDNSFRGFRSSGGRP